MMRTFLKCAGAVVMAAVGGGVACGQPVVTNATPPQGDVGTPYSLNFTATEAALPCILCTWSIVGTPPAGFSLDSTTGSSVNLTGTPDASDSPSFSVTVQATDLIGSGSATATVTINPAVGISPTSLPAGQQGVSYGQTISGANGTPPYTLAL